MARRGHRAVLDARLAEPGVDRGRQRDRRCTRADDRGLTGSRLLGGVVPGRLGLRDARADPALVLRAALHVGRARREGAVPSGALVREAPRRDRARDARQPRQRDRRRRGLSTHGSRRDALDVLRPAAEPEHPLRLRPCRGGQAQAPHPLELGVVPRHLRDDRGVRAAVRGPCHGSHQNGSANCSTAGSSRVPRSSWTRRRARTRSS